MVIVVIHTFASNVLAAGENPKWVADTPQVHRNPIRRVREVYSEADALDGSALLSRIQEESGQKMSRFRLLTNTSAQESG
jgi:hypothetical protein